MPELRPEAREWFLRLEPLADLEPMAGDASERVFTRLVLPDGRTLVGVDYGRSFEGETDDARMSRLFLEAGLPVARVVAVGPRPGCLVLEDLGRETLFDYVRRQGTTRHAGVAMLYGTAIRLATDIARKGTPVLARSSRRDGPVLDEARFRYEMDFFVEHYVGGHLGGSSPAGLKPALHELAGQAAASPRAVLCHRDYHSRNLVVAVDGGLSMVDVQDARWGPDTYDLASLVRDAYVDLDEDEVEALVSEYLQRLPPDDGEAAFRRRLATVSLQRMIKALGTFGYQSSVRGETSFLEGVPRTLRRIASGLAAGSPVPHLDEALRDAGVL